MKLLREWIADRCAESGIPAPDLDLAELVVVEIAQVEQLVGGDSNLVALRNLLDLDDEGTLRLAHLMASINARQRLKDRWEREGKRATLGPRDGMAVAEGVTAGVELAAALLRLRKRGEL